MEMKGRKVQQTSTMTMKPLYLVFTSVVLTFFALRFMELLSLFASPLYLIMTVAAMLGVISLWLSKPKDPFAALKRMGLIVLVLYNLKSELDDRLYSKDETHANNMKGLLYIVTGANSGTGLAIATLLYQQGATVLMTCRSTDKCVAAMNEIQALPKQKELAAFDNGVLIPAILDMNDLGKIHDFATNFQLNYTRLDGLVMNAGAITEKGARTTQGYEEALGSMHVGNFALSKWLLSTLTAPVPEEEVASERAARIVYVGSQGYMSGSFHSSLFQGEGLGDLSGELTDNCANTGPFDAIPCCPFFACPGTNGYARAKLANILHVHELQRRVDRDAATVAEAIANGFTKDSGSGEDKKVPRRVVTAVLHPGTVSTNIHPVLSNGFSSMFSRSSMVAGYVILHALCSNSFVPGSYIDGMKRSHDLQDYRHRYLTQHLTSYPAARDLPFAKEPVDPPFSVDEWWFHRMNFCWDCAEKGLAVKSADETADRLWSVTDRIVNSWKKARDF